MARSSSSPSDDEVFEQFKPVSSKPSSEHQAYYFASALFTVALPAYLYWTIKELSVATYAPVFGIVTVVCAYLLNLSYHNTVLALKKRLLAGREKTRGKRTQAELEAEVSQEAFWFALFYNNLSFLLAAVLLGFYLLRTFAPAFGYVLSVSLPAILLTFTSTSS